MLTRASPTKEDVENVEEAIKDKGAPATNQKASGWHQSSSGWWKQQLVGGGGLWEQVVIGGQGNVRSCDQLT